MGIEAKAVEALVCGTSIKVGSSPIVSPTPARSSIGRAQNSKFWSVIGSTPIGFGKSKKGIIVAES